MGGITLNKILLLAIIPILIIASCSQTDQTTSEESRAPTVEEILKENPEADIFQLNGELYIGNIDWVDELNLTKNKEIGEITQTDNHSQHFENGTATKLEAGTKVFSSNEREDIVIVEKDNQLLPYLLSVEG